MSGDSLIQALPDLVTLVSRDGVIMRHAGGHGIAGNSVSGDLKGRRLEEVWGEDAALLLRQLIRRALRTRQQLQGRFVDGTRRFEARVAPKGPERVLCVIRALGTPSESSDVREEAALEGHIERRGFFKRFQQSVADAALRERPLAVCMILLQGLNDIGRIIDFSISEKVATAAMRRLPNIQLGATETTRWYVGQLAEGLLAVVMEGSSERETLRTLGHALCDSLAEPVEIGDASFHLAPCGGIAILGQDARQPQALLEHARAAMLEARRSAVPDVRFYSDTLRIRPLSRLDVERELQEAIACDGLALRYAARHDLATDRLVAMQAYLRWPHPVRGDVRPAEFLPIAESTGLATTLSRWALGRLRRDLPALRDVIGPQVRISFGALRHHLASDALAGDVESLLRSGDLAPGTFELRVAEKVVAGLELPDRTLGRLADLGARLVVDEFGRGFTSLARLVHLPFQGLQLDRSFVSALGEDPAALRVCRAAAGLAREFGLDPISAGIDSEEDQRQMLAAGFTEGLGNRYGQLSVGDAADPAATARA